MRIQAELSYMQVRSGPFVAWPILAIGCWLLVASVGCAYAPLRHSSKKHSLLPESIAAYYEYPSNPADAKIELIKNRRGFSEFLVQFPLSASGFEPTEPVVEFEWFESNKPGQRPAILFNPILGGDYPLERGICRFFARHGFHVAMIRRKTLKISPEHSLDQIELLLRQGMVRIRQVTDWMASHERVDDKRLGNFGISMGGIASVMAAAIEPRLRAHVVVLAGGSIPDILRTSRDDLLAKPRQRFMEHNKMDIETLSELLNKYIVSDPIRLAPYVDRQNMLMVIALFDRTIGISNSLRLRRSLDYPATHFLPAGHYTAYFFLPYVKYVSLRFFLRELVP